MRILVVLVFWFLLLMTACTSPSAPPQASPNAKRYTLNGKIVSVDKAAKKAKIDHDRIEGFMDRMTMEFPIHSDHVWTELTPGVEIKADLVVDPTANDPYWLENIAIIAGAKPGQQEVAVDDRFAQIGHEVPDFVLTDQDKKKFSFKDYRGKAFAVTFIYARCPLPDYCIRMSTSFSDLALELNKEPDLKDKVRLVSISFDPENDTPEKLRSYGLGYLGKDAKPDFTIWRLAVAPDSEVRKIADFFGLRYEVDPNDKTQFIHSLRTAVVSPDGKVTKIFSGSDWTTAQLRDELVAASASATN